MKLAKSFDLKVVVVSGDASEIKKIESLDAGADGYLVKPLMIKDLKKYL